MSTREAIKRELESLGKLAETMGKAAEPERRSGEIWAGLTSRPEEAPVAAPPARTTPSTASFPPAVHSASLEAIENTGDADAGRAGRRGVAIAWAALALCAVTTAGTATVSALLSPHSPTPASTPPPQPAAAQPPAAAPS